MPDIEWRRGPACCHDLYSSDGTLLGYIMPAHIGVRAYIITHQASGLAKFSGVYDHADEAKARAWVEERARRALDQVKGEGGGDG